MPQTHTHTQAHVQDDFEKVINKCLSSVWLICQLANVLEKVTFQIRVHSKRVQIKVHESRDGRRKSICQVTRTKLKRLWCTVYARSSKILSAMVFVR